MTTEAAKQKSSYKAANLQTSVQPTQVATGHVTTSTGLPSTPRTYYFRDPSERKPPSPKKSPEKGPPKKCNNRTLPSFRTTFARPELLQDKLPHQSVPIIFKYKKNVKYHYIKVPLLTKNSDKALPKISSTATFPCHCHRSNQSPATGSPQKDSKIQDLSFWVVSLSKSWGKSHYRSPKVVAAPLEKTGLSGPFTFIHVCSLSCL